MPPKKSRKPLTPLQRKQLNKKRELIHKASVKSQYYKALNKKDDDTPDYVKEIFGAQEKTIDKDGNVIELEKSVEEQELNMESEESEESEEEDEATPKNKRQRQLDAISRQKPNPFKTHLEESERRKRETEEEKMARNETYKRQKEERKSYYRDRGEKRRKMLAKTKSGQPKMSARMDALLEQIEKGSK